MSGERLPADPDYSLDLAPDDYHQGPIALSMPVTGLPTLLGTLARPC